jgi:hypothetical protein
MGAKRATWTSTCANILDRVVVAPSGAWKTFGGGGARVAALHIGQKIKKQRRNERHAIPRVSTNIWNLLPFATAFQLAYHFLMWRRNLLTQKEHYEITK